MIDNLAKFGGADRQKYNIQLIVGDRGWIVEKIAREIAARLPDDEFNVDVLDQPSDGADLVYFVPYSKQRKVPGAIVGSWFTHQEVIEPAKTRFESFAAEADFCLTPAERYADVLEGAGGKFVRTIYHGVDLDLFTPSLRLGVVGRTYHTGRKGEELIASIMDIDGVELKFTGSGWPGQPKFLTNAELAEFYRDIDYLLIPSFIEGGPVPLFEALACGCPVISSDIGCVPSFPHISFKLGDKNDLKRVVTELRDKKFALRASVEDLSWARFGDEHANIFRKLLKESEGKLASKKSNKRNNKRFYIVSHGTEGLNLGGPTTRIQGIINSDLGKNNNIVHINGTSDLENIPIDSDCIFHVFNIWPLKTCLDTIKYIKSKSGKVVFSPIILNLSNAVFFNDKIVDILENENEANIHQSLSSIADITHPWVPSSDFPPVQGLNGHYEAILTACGLSDHIIFLSEYERNLAKTIGVDTRKSTIVKNGVNVEQFASADPELFENKYGLKDFVLVVGRIEKRKNQALIAHALKDVGASVVFVGHAPEEKYLRIFNQYAGENVVQIDRITDRELLASAYKAAQCLVMSSWSEGAPLVALEAAAAGTPLILSSMSSEPEYFGKFAEYCHPLDLDKLRELVVDKIQNSEKSAQRNKRTQWAKTDFDFNSHVKKTIEIYNSMLSQDVFDTESSKKHVCVDLTHLAHSLDNKGNPTGVTLVELELAKAIQENGTKLDVVVWNSPNNKYVKADFAGLIANLGNPANSRDFAIFSDSLKFPTWKINTNRTQLNSEIANTKNPSYEGLDNKHKRIYKIRRFVNSRSSRTKQFYTKVIRIFWKNFDPHKGVGADELPMTTSVLSSNQTAIASRAGFGEKTTSSVHIEEEPLLPTIASGLPYYVFGQPWISNDRQLDSMINFVTAKNLKLRPIIHDLLYVTDTGAFPQSTRMEFTRRLLKLTKASDELLVTSGRVYYELENFLGIYGIRKSIKQIPIGVPGSNIDIAPTKPNFWLPNEFVLYVSSINSRKNHEFIIDVWKLLAKKLPDSAGSPWLVLVGHPQKGFEYFRQQEFIDKLKEHKILIVNSVSEGDINWLYKHCLFTIYPSRSEGWGIPPLESLQFGKMCIVSDTIPSVVETSSAALVKIPPNDFFAWFNILMSFLTNPKMLASFNEKANEFSPQTWSDTVNSLLE